MYSNNLDSFKISSAAALVAVPSSGAAWYWMCQDWKDVPQEIHIVQADRTAIVMGLNRVGASKEQY